MRPEDEQDFEAPQIDDTADTFDEMALALIEEQADRNIRRVWHDGQWFFSVIDVIAILTESPRPRKYWNALKTSMKEKEGWIEVSQRMGQLPMRSADGKMRKTDAGDTWAMLRIAQSVPSPKAEPIKQWLAREGAKKLTELAHPVDPAEAHAARSSLPMPDLNASGLEWAAYHEQMALLWRRQYAYEAQLEVAQEQIEAHGERLEDHDEWLDEHAQRLEDHDTQFGDMRTRMERLEEGQQQLPDLLRRMGPQTLTPAHQAQVKALAVRLHDLGGFAFPTIYGELNTHFHVGKYSDIPDVEWEAVAAWFQVRLDAAEKRRNTR